MIQAGNKTAMEIAAAFFKGNVSLSLSAIAILIVIALFKLLPIVGVIFAFAYPILSFAIQIYVAREVPKLRGTEEMEEVARRTRLNELFTRHLDIAAGGFLGFFLILMLLSMIFMGLLSSSIDIQTLSGDNMEAFSAAISASGALGTLLLFLLLGMWLGYLMPGVMGEVILAQNFNEAFRKSLLLFSPSFWKRTFTRNYFILILIWSMIVFVAALLFSWIALSILLLPIALVGIYFLSLYNAVIYVFAREALADKQ
jgi:hypothetical protein